MKMVASESPKSENQCQTELLSPKNLHLTRREFVFCGFIGRFLWLDRVTTIGLSQNASMGPYGVAELIGMLVMNQGARYSGCNWIEYGS